MTGDRWIMTTFEMGSSSKLQTQKCLIHPASLLKFHPAVPILAIP